MDEHVKIHRRTFLRGAAAVGIVAAAPGGGLFIQEASAQMAKVPYKRVPIQEPAGVTTDNDVIPLSKNLLETSLEGAIEQYDAAGEAFVKGNAQSFNVAKGLEDVGAKFLTSEARSKGKNFAVPASIVKMREAQLKQKGWHSHAATNASVDALGVVINAAYHWHKTW
jgi:TAT (twin-arginine translocation) pathway signal sequence